MFNLVIEIVVILAGILTANALYAFGWPNYHSRKIAHFVAGVAIILFPVLFASWVIPFGIAVGATIGITALRLLAPKLLNGIGGAARPKAIAEIWFPTACALSIGVGWGWLGNPWLGVVPCLALAWGDAVTGVIRSLVYKKESKGLWGSAGMLIVGLLLAGFIQPYWIGAAGMLAATVVESRVVASQWFDDNIALVAAAVLVMTPLYLIWG